MLFEVNTNTNTNTCRISFSIPIPIPILGNLGFSIPIPIPILAKTPIPQYQYQVLSVSGAEQLANSMHVYSCPDSLERETFGSCKKGR